MIAALLLAGGVRDIGTDRAESLRRANDSARRQNATPRIEDSGRGWFRVVGGPHGPGDVYGREEAEACLARIREMAAAEVGRS